MYYSNVYLPVQSLKKAPVQTGGMCSLIYFKWEDVAQWPEVNPQTGIIETVLTMKPGGILYSCQAVEKGRTYVEDEKESSAGQFIETTITATLAGNTTANMLSVATMRHHRYGLLLDDRDGIKRLIGNCDSGAKFLNRYSPEDLHGSRKRELKWSWSHSAPAPPYKANIFPIQVGGVPIAAGSLQLVMRFQVGAPGAPMNALDEYLTDDGFANKNLLVIVSGYALPCDDGTGNINWVGSIVRHYEKTYESNSIHFVGAVMQDEIIEIYAWT